MSLRKRFSAALMWPVIAGGLMLSPPRAEAQDQSKTILYKFPPDAQLMSGVSDKAILCDRPNFVITKDASGRLNLHPTCDGMEKLDGQEICSFTDQMSNDPSQIRTALTRAAMAGSEHAAVQHGECKTAAAKNHFGPYALEEAIQRYPKYKTDKKTLQEIFNEIGPEQAQAIKQATLRRINEKFKSNFTGLNPNDWPNDRCQISSMLNQCKLKLGM